MLKLKCELMIQAKQMRSLLASGILTSLQRSWKQKESSRGRESGLSSVLLLFCCDEVWATEKKNVGEDYREPQLIPQWCLVRKRPRATLVEGECLHNCTSFLCSCVPRDNLTKMIFRICKTFEHNSADLRDVQPSLGRHSWLPGGEFACLCISLLHFFT